MAFGAIGGAIGSAIGLKKGKGLLGIGGQQQGGPPGYTPPKFDIRKTEEFIKDDKAPQIFGQDPNRALRERFVLERQRAGQAIGAQQGQALDAIKRRFAAIGGGPSGAQIKIEQQALERGEQQRGNVMRDISQAENEALESAQNQQRMAQFDADFRQKLFNFERGSKLHELNLAERQQQIGTAESQYTSRLNQFLNQPPKQGIISNLLSGIL